MNKRNIKRVWTVNHERISSKHKVGMVLPNGFNNQFDPFLFLAEDWFEAGVFDFHPHRGIETVTYVIEGNLEHEDNSGGKGSLKPGDVQWMTAGRGIIHKETAAIGETVHSLQLWINLPSSKKMTEPRYQNLLSKDIPERHEEGVIIRVFSGKSGGVISKTLNHVPVTMLEITLDPGVSFTQELPGSYSGFIYVLEGSGIFGENKYEGTKDQALLLDDAESNKESGITITAKDKLKVLLYAGEPVRERIVQYGPFVMNTKEEIEQAFEDYRAGKFN